MDCTNQYIGVIIIHHGSSDPDWADLEGILPIK